MHERKTREQLFWTGDFSEAACGRRLRLLRRLAGETIGQRAEKIGTSTNNLQSVEVGKAYPRPHFVAWIMENTPADFNFVYYGAYDRLPYADVLALEEAAREMID